MTIHQQQFPMSQLWSQLRHARILEKPGVRVNMKCKYRFKFKWYALFLATMGPWILPYYWNH